MIERFYTTDKFLAGSTIYLSGNEHHHLSRVMRMREGDEIELVNGTGSLASAKVLKIDKERTSVHIDKVEHSPLPKSQIMLGIPFMRPSKLEWVIEKGTEVGADAFYLYPADHSTQDSLSDHQIERLRNITISALKQSGRLHLPHLEILSHLESLLKKEAEVFFGDVRSSTLLFKQGSNEPSLFVTGPESGFSKEELELLRTKGNGVRINQNILRAETAPIVALSILSFFRIEK
jgi:16S rRNA (uracil1498-N3)-methyltransferase